MDDVGKRLAERVKREREWRGWSYADLVQRLADAGCPIALSPLWRIEHGERAVKVAELVAFATVFELPVADLLLSAEEVAKQDAIRVMSRLDDAEDRIETGVRQVLDAWLDLHLVWGNPGKPQDAAGADDDDVDAHVTTFVATRRGDRALAQRASVGSIMSTRGAIGIDDELIRNALVNLDKAIKATAIFAADALIREARMTARSQRGSNGKH